MGIGCRTQLCFFYAIGSMSGHLGTADARIAWTIMGHLRDRQTCAGGWGCEDRIYSTDPLIRRAGDEGLRRDARGASAQLARRDGPPSAREVGVFIPVAGADGWAEAPEVFVGGRRRTLGHSAVMVSAAAKHALQGGIASGSGAYVARAARAPGGVAPAVSAIDPGSAFAAAIAKAQQWHWCGPRSKRCFLVCLASYVAQ